jgi:hypothetical protein
MAERASAATTRIPVAVGEAALDNLAQGQFLILGFLLAAPITLAAVAFFFGVLFKSPLGLCGVTGPLVSGYVTYLCFKGARATLARAWHNRPTDFELDAEGIHGELPPEIPLSKLPYGVKPPPARRARVAWSELDHARCELVSDAGWLSLLVRSTHEGGVVAARVSEDAEGNGDDAPLDAIATLCRWLRSMGEPPRPDEDSTCPTLLRCPGCDARLAVDDAAQLDCSFCHHAVTVPDELRERVRASRHLLRERGAIDGFVQRIQFFDPVAPDYAARA